MPNDSLYRRPITENEQTHLFGNRKRSCLLGKGTTIQTNFSNGALPLGPRQGAAPHPARALPLGPRRGAAPHPSRATPLRTPFLLFVFSYTFGSTSVHSALP